MPNSDETPNRIDALRPAVTEVIHSDHEIGRLRFFLLVLMLVETGSVFVSRISNHWQSEGGFLPQILIGFVLLALILTLHLASQRNILREVSAALVTATSYVERLEQTSLIDLPTQLFNRRYLDELFTHQLKWLNRSGKAATLLLLEVIASEKNEAAEEIIVEAAFILRSTFRASDYVVRYCFDQFLVVLPDTNEQQAQIALSRLIEKVHHWNLVNEKTPMAICLELSTCLPNGDMWERVGDLERKMGDKSGSAVRMLIPRNLDACDTNELSARKPARSECDCVEVENAVQALS